MAEIEPVVLRYNAGKCPACRGYLWAEVTVAVRVSTPTLDANGTARAHASAEPIAMQVSHDCDKREGEPMAEWEAQILRDVDAEHAAQRNEPTATEGDAR